MITGNVNKLYQSELSRSKTMCPSQTRKHAQQFKIDYGYLIAKIIARVYLDSVSNSKKLSQRKPLMGIGIVHMQSKSS